MQALDWSWTWDHRDHGDMKLIIHTDPARALQADMISRHASDDALKLSTLDCDVYLDCDVNLQQDSAPQMEEPSLMVYAPPAHGYKELILHSVIVASLSAYFQRRLTTPVGRMPSSRNSDGAINAGCACDNPSSKCFRYEMVELVEPDQLHAAGAVLKFMYMHELPMASVKFILSMLQVADRWDVPGCVSACHASLALQASSLTLEDACTVCQLPSSLFNSPDMARTVAFIKTKLLDSFGSVVQIFNSEPLLQQWMQLPHAAVLFLLDSDLMVSDCEDSVVMVLSWWLEGEVGKMCGEPDILELQGAVRYGALSPTYLTQMLPQLPKLCISEEHTLELMDCCTWEVKSAGRIPRELLSVPTSWLRPPRPQPSNHTTSVLLTLDVTEVQLKELLANAAASRTRGVPTSRKESVHACFQGVRASLHLGCSTAGDIVCWVGVCAPLPTQESQLSLKYGLPCKLTVGMHHANPRLPAVSVAAGVMMVDGTVWNVSQLAPNRPGSPRDLAWWTPFLKEEKTKGNKKTLSLKLTASLHITPTVEYYYR